MAAESASLWVTLVPVIVGGIIGLTGGLVGPPLGHWLTEKAAHKKKLAAKLEELICILYEYDHWLRQLREINVFQRDASEPPSPLPKAIAIAAIHFPQFSLMVSELEINGLSYEAWMYSAGRKRLLGKIDDINEGFDEVYKPYYAKLKDVTGHLKVHARAIMF